jgi:hypothetical protein
MPEYCPLCLEYSDARVYAGEAWGLLNGAFTILDPIEVYIFKCVLLSPFLLKYTSNDV